MKDKVDLKAVMSKAVQQEESTRDENVTTGIIIDTKPEKPIEKQGVNVSALNKDVMATITDYLDEMDEDINEVKEEIKVLEEKRKETEKEVELIDETIDPATFKDKYEQAVVVIDKTKMGTVVNFTDEERQL